MPEFWGWLLYWGLEGLIKVPVEIVEEICGGTDDLAAWRSDHKNKVALELEEDADVALVRRVIEGGYAVDLDDEEIEIVGGIPS